LYQEAYVQILQLKQEEYIHSLVLLVQLRILEHMRVNVKEITNLSPLT